MKNALTIERLQAVLSYDRDSGRFTWRNRSNEFNCRTIEGSEAGHIRYGYRVIVIDRHCYPAHRLAWLYVFGRWPTGDLDHINLDKADNRLVNLREASRSQNQANVPRQRNNTSGFKGVHWHRQAKKWQAVIIKNRKPYSLGLFDDPKLAHEAYERKAAEFFAEFARG